MHKTYRPSIFSGLLQLKDLISENMKISKMKSKLLAKEGVFNIIFFGKKMNTVTYCFYQHVEFSITIPAIYVNI